MEQPLAVIRSRAPVRRAHPHPTSALLPHLRLLLVPLIVAAFFPFVASPAHAAPALWLPTPLGERWQIIQGYGCGTHNSWDSYAIDLTSVDGATRGAPARAAAAGAVEVWHAKSGTLILSHGENFYTQYTHLSSNAVQVGEAVTRGQTVGAIGDRGSPGTPHLHFHAYSASSAWARDKQTVPLSFAEGYDFPARSGCSQHQGAVVVASDGTGVALAGLHFSGEAERGRWYNRDLTISFQGQALAHGFSMAWDAEPAGDTPQNGAGTPGAAQLSVAGEGLHTLYVRGWDSAGQQAVSSFGTIGYDVSAPVISTGDAAQTVAANTPGAVIRWSAAHDAASGIAGYNLYLGPDAHGTSDWFVVTPEVASSLAAGSHILRIQARDYAGNTSAWATIGTVTAQ